MAGPREEMRLLSDLRGEFHNDEAIIEIGLLGQKYLGERTPTKILDQAIRTD